MIQLYQKIKQLKVLEHFIQNPYEKYYLRETARTLNMSPMTVKRSLDLLLQDKLITREKIKNQILYKANTDSPAYKHLKTAYNLATLEEKNITTIIYEKLPALSSLTLYGSYAKGENDRQSDIDLLAIAPKPHNTPTLTQQLENQLEKEVTLTIFTPREWTTQAHKNKAYYMDIITEGIVLYGNRPVVT